MNTNPFSPFRLFAFSPSFNSLSPLPHTCPSPHISTLAGMEGFMLHLWVMGES